MSLLDTVSVSEAAARMQALHGENREITDGNYEYLRLPEKSGVFFLYRIYYWLFIDACGAHLGTSIGKYRH